MPPLELNALHGSSLQAIKGQSMLDCTLVLAFFPKKAQSRGTELHCCKLNQEKLSKL